MSSSRVHFLGEFKRFFLHLSEESGIKNRIKVTFFVLVTVFVSRIPFVFAQKIEIPVDGKRILQTISYIASDQFLGRKPNTPEFFRLQEWVASQYKLWGLEPAGGNGSFYQSVPISREYAVNYLL